MILPGLVSIILPNRDHGHFLPRALDALLAQTHRQLELLVVDDASSDDSHEIVRRYANRDARVQLLELSEHRGINHAVDVALEQARGEYLYVAAADDMVAPDFFEKMVAQLEHHPLVGLCFSDPTEFHADGNRSIAYPLYLSKVPVFYDAERINTEFRRNYFHISANTAIYRAANFRVAGGYRIDLEWLSDWFVTHVIALRHGACYVPEQLTYVTIRADSYSTVNLQDSRAQRRLLDRLLELLSQPEYGDVASQMREAGLLPEYHVRILFWLAQSEAGRKLLTPRMIGRVFGRYIWSCFRPLSPIGMRRILRRLSSERGS